MRRRILALLASAALAASMAERTAFVALAPIIACYCHVRDRIAAVR